MATDCVSLISAGIVPNCGDPITKGYEHKGIIINWDDIDFTATTFSGANTISDLVLKDGKKAYEIVQRGNTPYTGSTSELAVGTISNTVTKNVQFTILNKGPKIAETVIDPLFNGKYVVILENTWKNLSATQGTKGDSSFEVFGIKQGMFATAATRDPYSSDTQGGWQVTMTETESPVAEVYLFKTSYEATLAMINSLVNPSPGV